MTDRPIFHSYKIKPNLSKVLRMNILLINPWITDFAAHDFWVKPLGLLYAGAFLARRGHTVSLTVSLIDCMDRFQPGLQLTDARKYNTGKFHREIFEKPPCLSNIPRNFCRYGVSEEFFISKIMSIPKPDAILVTSVMTYWYPGVFRAISLLHKYFPSVPVFLGGIYATLCYEHACKNSGADIVTTASSPSQIINLIEKETGIYGDNDIYSDSFDKWPETVWSLYPNLKTASVMTTRGCPLRCTVCASRILFDGFERRDPVKSACEILRLGELGVEDVSFCDDALLLGAEKHAMPMFEALTSAGNRVRLHAPNGLHVREITPEIAKLMKAAGFKTIRLSLETTSGSRKDDFSGKVTREEFKDAAESLIESGFERCDLGAYIMVGLPGQNLKEILDTVDFAWDNQIPVKPALFSPVPGTEEFDRAVSYGIISPDSDPLLQNNTLRTLDFFKNGLQGYYEFKDLTDKGNERIKNVN